MFGCKRSDFVISMCVSRVLCIDVSVSKVPLSPLVEIYIDYGFKLKPIYILFSEIRREWQFSSQFQSRLPRKS